MGPDRAIDPKAVDPPEEASEIIGASRISEFLNKDNGLGDKDRDEDDDAPHLPGRKRRPRANSVDIEYRPKKLSKRARQGSNSPSIESIAPRDLLASENPDHNSSQENLVEEEEIPNSLDPLC